MAQKKHYAGDFDALERKLARVCERLGIPEEVCWVLEILRVSEVTNNGG